MVIDYHMHLEQGQFTLPWLMEFLAYARQRGVDEIGVTEHAYRFIQAHGLLDNEWARQQESADLDEYVGLILEAKSLGHPVKLGIEVDYVPGKEAEIAAFLEGYPWDFVLGSVHWLGDWGIDLDPSTWHGRDIDRVYEDYYRTVRLAAQSGLFDIMSHLDLVKIFGFRPQGDVSAAVSAALDAVAAAGISIEVSSAGLRKPVGEIYPHRHILREAFRRGITVTLASDAHTPEHVGFAFPELMRHVRSAGYSGLARYAGRRRQLTPLPFSNGEGAG